LKTSAKHFGLAVGPRPGNMSQNDPKTTSLMMSVKLFKKFYRPTDPFDPLNSSLAQSTEELGRW